MKQKFNIILLLLSFILFIILPSTYASNDTVQPTELNSNNEDIKKIDSTESDNITIVEPRIENEVESKQELDLPADNKDVDKKEHLIDQEKTIDKVDLSTIKSKDSDDTLKTYSSEDAEMLLNTNAWVKINGNWYYKNHATGTNYKGWIKVENKWYYLSPDSGIMLKGWNKIDNKIYYLDPIMGNMKTGWVKLFDEWYYFAKGSGELYKGWIKDNNYWYFLDTSTGIMKTGWQIIFGKTYYFSVSSGRMGTGWVKSDNLYYYLDKESGLKQKGWIKIFEKWYYLNEEDGHMHTGWNSIDNKWYYLDPQNGDMQTKWKKINNNWYYLRQGYGDMHIGWIKLDGDWYYLDHTGALKTGYFIIGNEEHYSNSDGVWQHSKTKFNSYGEIFYLVLDPGHGFGEAHNRGGVLFNEGDQNFLFTSEIIDVASTYRNVIVTSTRNKITEDPSFEDRAKAGNGADLYVSIHSNAAASSVRGVEIWGSNQNETHEFGAEITRTWSQTLNTPNRGVKYSQKPGIPDTTRPVKSNEDTWFVFKENTAKEKYLLESVFHTNYTDSRVYLDNQKTLANKFMEIVAKHFGLTKK